LGQFSKPLTSVSTASSPSSGSSANAAASGTITEKQAEGMSKSPPPPNLGLSTENYLTYDVSFVRLYGYDFKWN